MTGDPALADPGVMRVRAPAPVAERLVKPDRRFLGLAHVEIEHRHAGNARAPLDRLDQPARQAVAARPGRQEEGGELRAARPGYGWLSEETEDDPVRLEYERVFIVDPIDGTRAYVALGRANHVGVVDVASREVLDYVLVGKRAWGLALTRDEKTLYVANGLSDDISIVDTASRRVLKSVPVGRVPYGILIDD